MAAYEINRNATTRHCLFAIDSESDLSILPTSKRSGTGVMNLSSPCRQGSVARTTAGVVYILSGNDVWTHSQSGGGGGGEEDIEPISTNTIENLFK